MPQVFQQTLWITDTGEEDEAQEVVWPRREMRDRDQQGSALFSFRGSRARLNSNLYQVEDIFGHPLPVSASSVSLPHYLSTDESECSGFVDDQRAGKDLRCETLDQLAVRNRRD
jgi:hypothetical protein